MTDARTLVGLLAHPDRLRIVATLVLDGPATAAEVSQRAGLTLRQTVDGLSRLGAAGLVEAADDEFLVLEAAFARAARAEALAAPATGHPDAPDDRRRVLDRCFREGRLVHIPAKHSTRRIVLEELAQRFEPGRHYTERQVNASLRALHPDTAALRRYLVDDGLLDRADGEYWRCGGPV